MSRWVARVDPDGRRVFRAIRIGREAGMALASVSLALLGAAIAGSFAARRSP